MIECENISYSYPVNQAVGAGKPANGALENVSCQIEDGSFVLLCGESGCGKTTLTRVFNGLIPHYYEGTLTGEAKIDGEDYKKMTLFDLSRKVGSVFQNPRSQFFNVDTTSELAFGCENHGMPEAEVRQRVAEVSELLQLDDLLGRSIFALSGGEKQKIACGSVSAMEPQVYVFDEPSSNLDPQAIAHLRQMLKTLKAQKKTMIVSEHRLYYLYDLADRVIYMKDGRIAGDYTAREFQMISESKREQMGLRPVDLARLQNIRYQSVRTGKGVWNLRQFHFAYPKQSEALSVDEVNINAGKVTAVIGYNGAGKTTFSRCISGLEKGFRGTLEMNGDAYRHRKRQQSCYMVMQDVNHQLFTESVLDEVMLSMPEENTEKAVAFLDEMDLLPYKDCHPMGLSGGQKQRVAIASAAASGRPLVLFDEPTSGLDLFHMKQVSDCVNRLANIGTTILVVTHDPEFILRCCDEVIYLEKGQIKAQYSLKKDAGRERLLAFFFSFFKH